MVSFGEKSKIKKAGNLNKGRSYVITTVFAINWYQSHSFLYDVSYPSSYWSNHCAELLCKNYIKSLVYKQKKTLYMRVLFTWQLGKYSTMPQTSWKSFLGNAGMTELCQFAETSKQQGMQENVHRCT